MSFRTKLFQLRRRMRILRTAKTSILTLFIAFTICLNFLVVYSTVKAYEEDNTRNKETEVIHTSTTKKEPSNTPMLIEQHMAYPDSNIGTASNIPFELSYSRILEDQKEKKTEEPKNTTYEVQDGDTLWSIAEKFYGDGSHFYTIKNANQEIAIATGVSIVIPEEPDPIETTTIPKLTSHTDLCAPINITVEQMNTFIAGFGNSASAFIGRGDIFIEAYAITGYNPLYLFGHAVLESSWGKGDLAKYKGNYFGIGAYDADPYNYAYTMATDDGSEDGLMRDGIINGAIWIKENWYDKGLTTLNAMIYETKYPYASAKDHWINSIVSLANQQLKLINN